MDIKRSGSQPSTKGPIGYFTGAVRVDPLFEAHDPARTIGASVTFEPSARTAGHTHPRGQTSNRHGWLWFSAALGWLDQANSFRSCRLVLAR